MAATYKRPESVLVVIAARSGEFLLLRRTQPLDFWQSVTGSLEAGETPEQAARREVWEETGLQAGDALHDCQRQNHFPIIPPWSARYAPGTARNTEHVFHLWLPRPQAICLNPAEHVEFRWLPLAEALRLASSHTNRDALRRMDLD